MRTAHRSTAVLAAFLSLAPVLAAAVDVPSRWQRAWPATDFSQIAVDPAEIISGGPPKDGIPAIDSPGMKPAAAETAISDREPVMAVALSGQTPRAYPIRYLMWHEIVNDRIGETPVAVTFCPLCNSGLVFDRRLDSRTLDFGVSGMLRHSDMVMFDRQTESWWQQFSGMAIVGALTGKELTVLPALLTSWQDYLRDHPEGLVMAEPQGYARAYGKNPYAGYDSGRPFLYRGEDPPHGIDPVARVVRVGKRAWPLVRVAEKRVLEEAGVRIEWSEGQASALDSRTIGEGREVGSVRVTDPATGQIVPHEVVFAFAFHAFEPDGTWMVGN